QRHLLIGIAVLLLGLIFLVDFFQRRSANIPAATRRNNTLERLDSKNLGQDQGSLAETSTSSVKNGFESTDKVLGQIPSFVFTGLLLGLIPLFNSAAFVAALAVAAAVFLLFRFRAYTFWLLITAVA